MNRNCLACGESTGTLMVGAVEGGSGPGRILYACLPHAREFAARPDAPPWLKDNLAARDGRNGEGDDAPALDGPG